MSQQIVLAAWRSSSILGCIKRGIASRAREMIISLYCPLGKLSGALHQVLELPAQVKCEDVGVGPEEGHKVNKKYGEPFL